MKKSFNIQWVGNETHLKQTHVEYHKWSRRSNDQQRLSSEKRKDDAIYRRYEQGFANADVSIRQIGWKRKNYLA